MKRFIVAVLLVVATELGQSQPTPVTLTAQWAPNPASENVTAYVLQLDNDPTFSVSPSTCTPTLCSTTFQATFGQHTITLVAQNLFIDTDPSSVQSSAPASVSFRLNASPRPVENIIIIRR